MPGNLVWPYLVWPCLVWPYNVWPYNVWPYNVWPYNAAEVVLLSLAVVAVVLLAAGGFRRWRALRVSPEERERGRRAMLVARGKMGDAVLVEVHDDLIFFSYSVRGVEYTASQDVSALIDFVPPDLASVDAMTVKYLPQNPANSIVLAEAWSGLRQLKRE